MNEDQSENQSITINDNTPPFSSFYEMTKFNLDKMNDMHNNELMRAYETIIILKKVLASCLKGCYITNVSVNNQGSQPIITVENPDANKVDKIKTRTVQDDTNESVIKERPYIPKPSRRVLTDEVVELIKGLQSQGVSDTDIAKQLNQDSSLISAIRYGKTYKEVPNIISKVKQLREVFDKTHSNEVVETDQETIV